jgi:hypothetical protein
MSRRSLSDCAWAPLLTAAQAAAHSEAGNLKRNPTAIEPPLTHNALEAKTSLLRFGCVTVTRFQPVAMLIGNSMVPENPVLRRGKSTTNLLHIEFTRLRFTTDEAL